MMDQDPVFTINLSSLSFNTQKIVIGIIKSIGGVHTLLEQSAW
jgi:hypothetical protein